MIKFGFSLLLLIIPIDLLAQSFTPDPDWRFESFNSQNHFISKDIPNLTIDKHGYLWSCSGGIQRFDGYRTINFNSFDKADGGLRNNYTNVVADEQGRIWISSLGLCYYDDASGKFIYLQTNAKRNITYINAFCVQKDFIWFVCDYGLAKLNLQTLKISFTSLAHINDALCTYLVDKNTLLLSSREKIYIYDIAHDTYAYNTLTYNHSLLKIFTVTKKGPEIFLGTNQGLFLFKNLHEVALADKETNELEINDILFLPQDKAKKYLFMATEGKGILIYNTISKKIEFTYVHDENNPYSLANNLISSFLTDKMGRLWISTSVGVSMLDVFNQQWKMRFINNSNTGGLTVLKICGDKSDSSKAWISSFNQGLICINWKTKKIERIFKSDHELKKLYDFVQISKTKWLLVTQKKILEWNPQAGIIYRTGLPVADSLSLIVNIRKLVMADSRSCFITTNKGLFKYDLRTRKITFASQCPHPENIDEALKYDLQSGFYDNGMLWVVSRNGLLSYDVSTKQTRVYRGRGEKTDYFFFDISNTGNNQVVCASSTGITIFNKKTKEFTIYNSIANLYKPHCEKVICIKNMVWIGTEAGILNFDLDTHKSARAEYETPRDVFPSSPFTIIGNDLVLGFNDGYAYFTPDLKSMTAPSDPLIETVHVNNKPVFESYPYKKNSGGLVFNYLNNSINIAFTAFLYTDPDHINFRYRLNGADSKWQYTEGQRSANYSQLPPGSYTFNLQSGNKNGVWNKNLASFNFTIQPPYWETWWFRTCVISIIAFGLYRLYRYKINHILAIERIRERIASDFHDDIGSALSSISIFSEVVDKQLRQKLPPDQIREIVGHISLHSRAMLDAMDDIIWAVNPQNDQFNDLAVRMREFAIPLLEARNILFDFDVQDEILNTRIEMEARKNIFLIFKECINNILKHSGCSAMKVTIDKSNNQLGITISDNGHGFDINAPSTRNGLKNMQKRAAEIKGNIQVISQPGNGTVTRLVVNII